MLNKFSKNHLKGIEDFTVVMIFTYTPYPDKISIDN